MWPLLCEIAAARFVGIQRVEFEYLKSTDLGAVRIAN